MKKEATFAFPNESKTFDLLTKRRQGAIAQSVEQRTENPCVAGSIPAGTTKKPLT